MAALERFDDQHCAAATGARFPQCEWCGIILGWWFLLWCACPNQGSDLCKVDFTLRGHQQAIVPDPVEPVGQNMHHETADELVCCQAHHLLPVTTLDAIVLPSERYGVCIGADEALVRDRDTVRVTTEVA